MSKKYLFSLVPVLFSMSCATTRIFPIEDGNFKIVIHSATESGGYDKALGDIKSYCGDRGLSYEVMSDIGEYVGVDRSVKAEVSASDNLSRDERDLRHADTLDRKDDNRVTITFHCK